MGTRVGPNYANIFMGVLEGEFLNSQSLKPLYYKRFIDDVFLIWTHGQTNLITFIDAFNSAHPSISFSYQYSPSTVNFLDVNVTVSEGKLITKLYRKPTDKQQYLHFQSSHVKHCKTGIPYSQAHRFRRICSKEEDFNDNCKELRSALLKQKYPVEIIDNAIDRARNLNRSDILRGTKTSHDKPQTNLVLTHSASVPKVSSILKKHYNILTQSERLKHIFPEPPRVVYRRNKNIRDVLTSSKIRTQTTGGCSPCGKPRCQICTHMSTTDTAVSSASDFRLKIKGNLNCDSSNVVYLLECTVCHLQYIGQTQKSFRSRFNNHKSHSKTLPSLPLSKHVNLPGHSFDHLRATILESGFRSHHDRLIRESYLIYKFKSASSGINESLGKLSSLVGT